VGVGSNSNVGENGMEAEECRAAVLEVDPASGNSSSFLREDDATDSLRQRCADAAGYAESLPFS
jgi:hypothetical protein